MKPKLRWHRTNKVQHYDELTTLFTVSSATGAFSRSSNSNTASRLSTPSIQGSTLIPVSHRIRTRGVPLHSDSKPEIRLSKGHFLVAIDFLTAEAKASVFITLNSSIRDMWLCKNTDVKLI